MATSREPSVACDLGRDDRIELYRQRWWSGQDIFTGKPRNAPLGEIRNPLSARDRTALFDMMGLSQ